MKLYISEENLLDLVFNALKDGYTMKEIHEELDRLNVTTNVKEVK